MNGESQVLVTETVMFPMTEKEVSEEQSLKTENRTEVKIVTTEIHIDETRFARLKKSLRKRSASIL